MLFLPLHLDKGHGVSSEGQSWIAGHPPRERGQAHCLVIFPSLRSVSLSISMNPELMKSAREPRALWPGQHMVSRLPSSQATSQGHLLRTVQLPHRVLRDGQVSESNYSAPCGGWSHSLVQPTNILPSPREMLCHSRLDLSALSQTTQRGPKGHRLPLRPARRTHWPWKWTFSLLLLILFV